MELFALPGFAVLREVLTFALVVGGVAFLAWEASAKRTTGRWQWDLGALTGGRAGPAMAGALAGAAAFVAGAQMTEPFWG